MAAVAASSLVLSALPKVDLKNPSVLAKYVADEKYLPIASQIASKALTQCRGITRMHKYGQLFPIRSELLAYAMQSARGETALEIAGADGTQGILLALAGAKRTYVNDIVPDEMALFRQSCRALPEEVSSKLEAVEGDCFNLLQLQPKLKESCGLVLCNNFIHFLNDRKLAEFCNLLKTVLKIGGIAIVTANRKGGSETNADPKQTAFANINCLSTIYRDPVDRSLDEVDILARSEVPIPGDKITFDYVNAFVYRKNPALTGGKWVKQQPEIDKLTRGDKEFVREVMGEQAVKDKIKGIQDGAIRVLKSTARKFNETDLRDLFTAHGFTVESAFVEDAADLRGRAVAIFRRTH